MSDNLTFGVKLEGSGSLVPEAKSARDEMVNLKQATDNLASSASQMASGYSGLEEAMKAQNYATTETSASINKLLDRYDPLGVKLRQLEADFKALNAAVKSGAIADGDLEKADAAYARIKQQIEGVTEATGKSAFATAGAKRELMVLGHEAMTGNFSQMPGSFMVLAERMHLTEVMLNPLTIGFVGVGAAAIGMAVAIAKGHAEMEAMDNALILTSGYAGVTRGGMEQLAATMAASGQVTIGTSKEIVTQLVASGRIGSGAIRAVAELTSNYARATGQDIEKIAPEMVKLFSDPLKGAEELNKSMHFLTSADLEHINVLQQLGETQQAQLFMAEKATEHMPKEAENVGTLIKLYRGLAGAISKAADGSMSLGKTDSIEEQIIKKQHEIQQQERYGNSENVAIRKAELMSLMEEYKQKQIAMLAQTTEDEKLEHENATMAIAKQYSELYKNYELKLKIANIKGGELPTAPTDDAIKADAVTQLGKKSTKNGDHDAQSAQHIADEIAAERGKYEEILAVAQMADLKGEALLHAKETRDLDRMKRERNREIAKHHGSLVNQAQYEQAVVARVRQTEAEVAQLQATTLVKFQAEQAANQQALLAIEVAGASSRRQGQMADDEYTRALAKARGTWKLQDEANYQHGRAALETAAINEQHALKVRAAKGDSDLTTSKNVEKITALRKGGMDEAKLQALIDEDKLLVAKSLAQKLTDLEAKRLADIRALMVADATAQNNAKTEQALFFENLRDGEYSAAAKHGEKMVAGAAQHNRAAFEINKRFAEYNAIVAGKDAVVSAYRHGNAWGGPLAGALEAGIAFAFVADQISSLESTSFGGSGSGGSPNISAQSIPSPSPSVSSRNEAPPAAPASAPVTQVTNITVLGAKENPDKAIFSYNWYVNTILPLEEAAARDGHRSQVNMIAG